MKKTIIYGMFLFALLGVGVAGYAHGPVDPGSGQLPSLAPMLKNVNPAVVSISVSSTQEIQNPLYSDPFFRRFFNVPPGYSPKRRSQSAGSGVIVDADKGTIITNHHVVDGADEIKVQLNDGRILDAKLVGSDSEVDIAVLSIKPDKLSELDLADSDKLEVGDFVVAVGNPFGLGHTVTTGVVSALGRSGLGIEGYENFIQTDASINPGNSGGALVNLRGELVGINTAILAPAGGNVGIGFAIPINMARHSLEQILEHGEVKRGRLGVMIQDLTPDLAQAFDFDANQRGVLVSEVQPNSPAQAAGIRPGDIIIELNGKALANSSQLRNEVGLRRAGTKVELTLLRDGKHKKVQVQISESASGHVQNAKLLDKLDGLQLANNQDGDGVLITAIDPGSPAADSGLRRGDVILSVNRQAINSVDDFVNATQKIKGKLLLHVLRGNGALYLVVE